MKNLGIIACGDVAFRTYIPGILANADRGTVTATFDPVSERADRAAALFPNATAYTDFDAFLAHPGLDGVFNLTPAPLHAPTTRKALAGGKHVFSEKPIAPTVAEGQELAKQAKDAGLILLCAPGTMATDRFQWIKSILDSGRMGSLNLGVGQMANLGPAAWRQYTGDPSVFYAKGVGPVLDIAVYVLHGITGLMGPAKRVEAFGGVAIPERTVLIPRLLGQKIEVGANDIQLIHLDFGDNRFAQILASFAVPATKAPAIELHGSLGSVSIEANSWYDSNGPIDLYLVDSSPLSASGWMNGVSNPNPVGPPGEHLIGTGPRDFINSLEGNTPILTAEHAIHVLEIILAADQSASAGGVVELSTTF